MLKHPLRNSRKSTGMERITLTLQQNQLHLEVIQKQLPKQLAEHCLHAVFNNNKLMLFTDSPVWASKLLYSRVKIIDAIASHFRDPVQGLTIRVVDNSIFAYKKRQNKPFQDNTSNLNLSDKPANPNALNNALNKLANVLQNQRKLNRSR